MEWIEAKIEFEADTTVVAEELLAEVFYAFGVKGVVVEDPETEAPPEALMDEDARPPTNSVGGYFPASAFDQERRRAFEHAVTAQAERGVERHGIDTLRGPLPGQPQLGDPGEPAAHGRPHEDLRPLRQRRDRGVRPSFRGRPSAPSTDSRHAARRGGRAATLLLWL